MSRMIPHGTVNGYNNYRCRCEACRVAKGEYMREMVAYAKARAAADPALIFHGTINAYNYWGCRCPACTEARRLGGQRYRAAHAP